MTTTVVKIVDPDGTVGVNCDYTNLQSFVVGEMRDLVALDEIAVAKCRCTGGTADVACTVDGFTTDANHYIKIWTDPAEGYRHNGTYQTGNKYRIEGTNGYLLLIKSKFVYIDGIEIGLSITPNNSYYCFCSTATPSGAIHYYSNCIAKGISITGTGAAYGFQTSAVGLTVYLFNCLAYGFISANTPSDSGFMGFRFGVSTIYCYNCTAYGNYYGFYGVSGTHTAKNCVSANNTSDLAGLDTVDYCASDDGTGTHAQTLDSSSGYANEFVNAAGGDFHLVASSICIGNGVDNPGAGLYSDDVDGQTRTSTWDIGFDEYVTSTTAAPTTVAPTTLAPTLPPTTLSSTTLAPPTSVPTTLAPTTAAPTPTTLAPTTIITTASPSTTAPPTTLAPTTAAPTLSPTTGLFPTTFTNTSLAPTTAIPAILCTKYLDSVINSIELDSLIPVLLLNSIIPEIILDGDLCR